MRSRLMQEQTSPPTSETSEARVLACMTVMKKKGVRRIEPEILTVRTILVLLFILRAHHTFG